MLALAPATKLGSKIAVVAAVMTSWAEDLTRMRTLTSTPAPSIRIRQILPTDFDSLADLLPRGFRHLDRNAWLRRFKRLSEHPTPAGFPTYGYLMEHDATPIGALLLIFSAITVDGETKIRCYVSSWYVEPEFTSHAALLASRALRYKHVTYLNVTPHPHTLPILVAQGYRQYCSRRYVAAPLFSRSSRDGRVQAVMPDVCADEGLQSSEIELLLKHASYGCISLTCNWAGARYPFVFNPRRRAGMLAYARLVYCRRVEDFVRFSGPLGRFLARRGFPLVVLDANGPVRGLIGTCVGGYPKYFKGPHEPCPGDLAYSPGVMFGASDSRRYGGQKHQDFGEA